MKEKQKKKTPARNIDPDIPVPEALKPLADLIAKKFKGSTEEEIVLQLPFSVEVGRGENAKTFEVPRLSFRREAKVREIVRAAIEKHAGVFDGDAASLGSCFATYAMDLCEVFLSLLSDEDAETCREEYNSLDMKKACEESLERVLVPLAMASLTGILGLVDKIGLAQA